MSSMPGEQNKHAVLKGCLQPFLAINWMLNGKRLSYSPKLFAYTPTACMVGMAGTCSLLNHAWESIIWHRLIWA